MPRKSPGKTLIGLCCAATLLDLDQSTIRKGLCGTDVLSQVRRGNGSRQRVSLILEEVVALKAEWIEIEERKRRLKILDRDQRQRLVIQ